ncbi:MAG: aminotransferase class IV [Phycisphaerales bacterium]|nr:aminotransferase class IV [Planctomycetota bacterium]MCH8508009.1 aminotransferase class IV [Phycisphaerales bacterium]
MPEIFLDGKFVDRAEARVSASDAGLLHAVGLFETMSARLEGETVAVESLGAHLDRLGASADELGLSTDLRTGPLGEAVVETVRRSGHPRARVRLTVTGGDLNMLRATGRSGHSPTILIDAQPATAYPDAMFEKGVMIAIADAKANPLDPTAGHKTLNYWWRLRELQKASARGAGEAVVLQVSNHLCGGCVSNIFAVHGQTLITPIARGEEQEIGGKGAIPSPVLPGITRARVIAEAKAMGLTVERRMMGVGDILDADEVFLTNSSWGVLPVTAVEAEPVAAGTVGETARALRERLGV